MNTSFPPREAEALSASARRAAAEVRRYATSTESCTGSSCVRTLGRWTCQTAAYHAFPRLFSCQRGSRRVAAYSIAD